MTDAFECVNQMTSELERSSISNGFLVSGRAPRVMTLLTQHFLLDFRQRSSRKLEHLGDTAVDAQRYDEAISHYTTALSLNPPSPQDLLIKRSKAFLATGSWKQVLDDANQVHHFPPFASILFTHYRQAITLDPSSPWGYEMKHAALHKAGDYDNAVDAFEVMLSKIAESPDPDVQRELYPVYPDKNLLTLFDRTR
jgi:tetratricopeptide (TPR) repeat protein